MSRKSSIITLCILGTLGAVGACCCCSGYFDPDKPNDPDNPNHHPGGGHVWHRGPGWIFWGGGSSHPVGPVAVGNPHGGVGASSPRGGFGATASGHSSSGGSSSSGG